MLPQLPLFSLSEADGLTSRPVCFALPMLPFILVFGLHTIISDPGFYLLLCGVLFVLLRGLSHRCKSFPTVLFFHIYSHSVPCDPSLYDLVKGLAASHFHNGLLPLLA